MKFKIDENIPQEVKKIFKKEGYDCSDVYEERLQGQNDGIIRKKCDSEKRILISLDKDFADIRRYKPAEHSGAIIVRTSNQSYQNVV